METGQGEEDSDFELVVPTKRQRSSESPSEEPEKKGKWSSVITLD